MGLRGSGVWFIVSRKLFAGFRVDLESAVHCPGLSDECLVFDVEDWGLRFRAYGSRFRV